MSLFYSLTDWDGYSMDMNFVGLENFKNIPQSSIILQAFSNTIYYAVVALVVALVCSFLLALFLFEKIRGQGTIKVLIYIPIVISPVIISYLWLDIYAYDGLLNEFIRWTINPDFTALWLANPNMVKNSLIIINTWQGVGYGVVILLAGLSAIPKEVTEAAIMDGAVSFKRFKYITLPMIMPSVTILLFLSITGLLKVFDLPFIMTKGGPMNASKMVALAIFDYAFSYRQFGMAGAIGVVFFIFIAIISVTQLSITRRQEIEM